jgi:alkylated DNA repair dioxygenase AlkB
VGAWEAEAIPDWLTSIVPRIEAFGGAETPLRQVLCNEYEAGIGWHRDKPRFDGVFGLSLGSAGRFRFRGQWERFTLNADPRSLYLLPGPSRRTLVALEMISPTLSTYRIPYHCSGQKSLQNQIVRSRRQK